MALLGNYSLLHKSPAKYMTGAVAYGDRANWNKPGMQRSMGAINGLPDWKLASLPQGFGAFGAWMLPRTAGGMTSRRLAVVQLDGSGNGALGYGIVGVASVTLSAAATGGLIAGGVGTATISLNASGSITATISSTGTATISLSGTANIGALGWLGGAANLALAATMTSYAVGHMTGSTADTAAVTPTTVAQAVWQALSADFNSAGTMGAKLNAAASGGVDYNDLAAAVWSHATADEIVAATAVIEKILRNKSITDPATGEFVLFDNDGTTELFRVALWEDAAATQPYRGQGGERRERLA